jgi:tetratricopeptide (TPR) repeat protein
LDPDDPEAMAEQGRAMLLLGLHEEAQNVLKESAKKVDPPLAVTLTGLGAVYERKNLKDIARDFYRQALNRQPDRLDAACGMLRTRASDGSSTLALDVLELCSQLPTPFARLKVWLTLLKAAFMEGCPKEARALKEKVYPEVVNGLTEGYRAFLENSEARNLIKLAKDLEADGEPEKAREIWRYAVTSPLTELTQKASTELKRLDTYESTAVAAAPLSPTGEDDPLMSLLSGTIPEDDQGDSLFASEAPNPAAVKPEEADLFADETSPAAQSSAEDDVPLFSDAESTKPTDDVLDALFAVDAPLHRDNGPASEDDLFAEEQPVAVKPPEEDIFAAAEPDAKAESEGELLAIESPVPASQPGATLSAPPADSSEGPEGDLFASSAEEESLSTDLDPISSLLALGSPAAPGDDSLGGQALAPSEPPPVVVTADEPPVVADPSPEILEQTSPVLPEPPPAAKEEPADDEEPLGDLFSLEPPVDAPLPVQPVVPQVADAQALPTAATQTPSPPAPTPDAPVSPLTAPPSAPLLEAAIPTTAPFVEISVPSQVVREELLPIPMAADFSPLTRRQLHYHEALASSSGSGMVNPESLAHLLLQSVVGHEPPDPSSEQGTSSVSLLQKALVASALELEQAEQFRGAVRVLRTALLYQPDSEDVLDALGRVQGRWAEWLVDQNEFAHAVSLLRDSLQRQPDNDTAAGQLEAHYHSWMDWSDQSGDPAARDLLAVYLEQEQSALDGLRQEWEERKARTLAAAHASAASARAVTAPPPVSATMPTTPPPPVAAPTPAPVAAPVVSPAAAEAPSPAVPVAPAAPPAQPPVVVAGAQPAAPAAAAVVTPASPAAAPPAAAPPTAAPPAAAPAAAAPAAAAPAAAAAAPAPELPKPAPVQPKPALPAASQTASAGIVFDSKEEAIETLEAAPDDDSVAEGVFAIYADSMRDLTTLLKERSNSAPEQPAWLLLLARAFRRSGSETMAVIQYQKYIKVAPSPEAYEELAQTYEELGKEDFAKMTRRKAERA